MAISTVIQSIRKMFRKIVTKPNDQFPGSEQYWIQRYAENGNSGAGSYDKLAEFKADILNNFVAHKGIESIIEYGCGDGNQLKFSKYPKYIGFDVSEQAIKRCNALFTDDHTKSFKLISEYSGEVAQLTLSLDVIYHLIEDSVFLKYMEILFKSSTKYTIVYSSNTNDQFPNQSKHVRNRLFSDWISSNMSDWTLIERISNPYPYTGDHKVGSFADFYVYAKRGILTS